MYFVIRYLGLTSSWKMNWHYFGTRHGKGEWDGAGAGAIVKRALKAKQFHNLQRRLYDAFDVVNFFERRVIMHLEHPTHMKEASLLSLGNSRM